MIAIKKVRKLIEANPSDPAAQGLARLVLALESETAYPLDQLYQLDYKHFELALEILKEWRLDRYYAKKLRLVDASVQAQEMDQAARPAANDAMPTDLIPPPA